MSKYLFKDIVKDKEGFLRGPFGGDLKKSIFVPFSKDCYKVYEQGVVLQQDESIGRYYISKEYFDKKMSKFEVLPNDFLVSCSGVNYGAIYELPQNIEQGVINQALLRIRLNMDIIDSKYFYYFFKSYIVQKITGGSGDSTIPNFPPMDVVKNIEINIPDLNPQKIIGNILQKIDKKIELNNKINTELEQMAKTLYDYWFVQFDFPDQNGNPYKSSGGKMTYNPTLKREIPEDWEVKKMGDILLEQKKSSVKVNQVDDSGVYPFFTSGNDILKHSEYFVNDMHCYLSTGGNASIKYYYGKASYSTDTWCISAKEYSFYLYTYLSSIKTQMDILYFAGTGLKHLQKDNFKNSYLLIPPKNHI